MNFCQKISGSFSILKISPFCTLQIGIFFSTKTWTRKPPWPQNIRLNVEHFFGGRIPPTEKKWHYIMGFSAVFCFSFWGGGVKLSNPSKAPFMAFGPKRRQAAAEANCFPPMNPTKDVSSRFLVKHFTSDYGKFSFHTEAKGKGPVVAICVSFRSMFHVPKFSPNCSGSSWTPTIPSTRRLPLSRCSRANTARQSRPSLL